MTDATAILNQLNIVAGDMQASREFYRRLGVRFPEPAGDTPEFHASGELANDIGLDLDSTHFAQVWNSGWAGLSNLAGRIVLGFHVRTRDRVDQTYADLTGAGYRGLQAPFDAFWGARYAIVEDPDGIAVGLMSPVDPTCRYWPPENWKGQTG